MKKKEKEKVLGESSLGVYHFINGAILKKYTWQQTVEIRDREGSLRFFIV